jgi:cytidyltransferase-like protein
MTIFISACFDILHVGHFNLLMYARQLATRKGDVIVSLDSDEKIKRDKGTHRPVFTFQERKENLLSLAYDHIDHLGVVNQVLEHNDNMELLKTISLLKPDYIVVGSEYRHKPVVGSEIAPVMYYRTLEHISSTKIINRINEYHTKVDRESAKP